MGDHQQSAKVVAPMKISLKLFDSSKTTTTTATTPPRAAAVKIPVPPSSSSAAAIAAATAPSSLFPGNSGFSLKRKLQEESQDGSSGHEGEDSLVSSSSSSSSSEEEEEDDNNNSSKLVLETAMAGQISTFSGKHLGQQKHASIKALKMSPNKAKQQQSSISISSPKPTSLILKTPSVKITASPASKHPSSSSQPQHRPAPSTDLGLGAPAHSSSSSKRIITSSKRPPPPSNIPTDPMAPLPARAASIRAAIKVAETADVPPPPKISKKKKRPLYDVLNKLLELFKAKDVYGIFREPVDPAIVPDYHQIIKNPMDFGTMAQKISDRKYRDVDEFRADFYLVVNNAKIYNAPTTIYYKTAEKLRLYGIKMIDRESPYVLRLGESNRRSVENDNFGGGSSGMSLDQLAYQSHKKKLNKDRNLLRNQLEDLIAETHLPDGTKIPDPEQTEEMWKYLRFGSLYQQHLNTFSVDHNVNGMTMDPRIMNASFLATGPYTQLDLSTPVPPPPVAAFYTSCDLYGDAYFSSLERFAQGLAPGVKKRVDRIINETTNGARQLVDCLMNNLKSDAAPTTATADSGGNSSASMEDADGKEKVDHDEEGAIKKEKERGVSSPATTITAWGAVDIKALIRHVESESKNLLAKAELLQWKKEVVDISILLTPVTTINDDFATRPTAELFEGNKEDVKLLDVLKEDRINNLSSNRRRSSRGKRASSAGTGGGLESAESVDDMTLSEEERIVLERIRRRLLHLIQRAPHDNFKAKAVPTSLVTGKQQQHQLHPNSNNNNNVNSRARK